MQTKIYLAILLLATAQLFTENVKADDGLKWSELRLFTMTNTFAKDPTALNNLTAADHVQTLDSLTGIGIEADARYKWFKVGTRLKGILMSKEPVNAPTPSSSSLTVSQYSGGLLARIPIVEKDLVIFDAVLEAGVANTKIDVQTNSSGKGTFTNNSGFYGRAGASLGIGWPTFKFYVEAGEEWNNLSNMSFEGNLANNITSVDFTGPYYAAGIIIYGLPSWIKPGSVTVGK